MTVINAVVTKPGRMQKGMTPINVLFRPWSYLWKLPFDNNSRKRAGRRGLGKGGKLASYIAGFSSVNQGKPCSAGDPSTSR